MTQNSFVAWIFLRYTSISAAEPLKPLVAESGGTRFSERFASLRNKVLSYNVTWISFASGSCG
jgi:hypothetical protein